MPNRWRVFVANTVSGRVVADIPFTGTPQAEARINEPGSWSIEVPLGGNGISATDLDAYSESWRWSWGVAYGAHIIQCGPVVSENYNGGNTTTITGTGLRGLFDTKRVAVSPAWYLSWVPGQQHWESTIGDVVFKDLSLHSIARGLVASNLSRSGHALPVVLPDIITGSEAKTFFGYDLATVGEKLQELSQLDGGPELEFRPEWTDDNRSSVRWRMRIGNPRLGNLGFPHAFDYGRALTAVTFTRDGGKQVRGHWSKGDGTERTTTGAYWEDRAIVDNTPGDFTHPMLEDVDTDHSSEHKYATLLAYSKAYVKANGTAPRLLSATIRVDGTTGQGTRSGSPSIDQIAPGDTGALTLADHPRLPDGTYRQRILGYTIADLASVNLTLQDVAPVAA